MSGGHWNYSDEYYREMGVQVASTFEFLAVLEHELDWGICGDTCYQCVKNRMSEALEAYFGGNTSSAIALARDRHQFQCPGCATR